MTNKEFIEKIKNNDLVYEMDEDGNVVMTKTTGEIFKTHFKQLEKDLEELEKYRKVMCEPIVKLMKDLERLEQIEEELGCPIEVLVEALKNGIWTYQYWDCEKEENKDKLKLVYPSLYFEHSPEIDTFMFNCGDHGYYSEKLKDYKKTWWLKENKEDI